MRVTASAISGAEGEREGRPVKTCDSCSSFHSCMDALAMKCADRAANIKRVAIAAVNARRHELRET